MVKWRFALLGLFLVSLTVGQAQVLAPTDSITRQLNKWLEQGPVPPMVRVVQVRAQLAEDLQRDEVRRVPLLLDYMARTIPDSVVQLRPYEVWALLASAGEFGPFLQRVKVDNPLDARPRPHRQEPPRDGLFELTQAYLTRHADELRARAGQAHFPAEDSTFLQLALQVMSERHIGQQGTELNEELQRFMARYPRSEYGYFVNRVIRPEYVPSRFRYGLDFHSGNAVFTGGLGEAFRPRFNLGQGFEFGWDRYMLYLRNYLGWAEARTDFTYEGRTWPAGQRLNYYLPEISVGYRFESRHFHLVPFVGLAWCGFSPTFNDANTNPAIKMDVTMRHPLTAGLNLDVLLWKTQDGPEIGSWILKIRSGVRATEVPSSPNISGSLLYLDVGIGGFGRMMHRKQPGAR